MALNSSLALEIAGGSSSAFFARRDLLQRRSPKFLWLGSHSLCRRKMSAAARLELEPATALAPVHASCVLPARIDPLSSLTQRTGDERERITPEKLDELMYDSVKEIVKNISKAPFLMQVFMGEGGPVEEKWRLLSSSPRLSVEREAAAPENWPGIMKRWEQDSRVPDGIILVEELEEEKEGGAADGNSDEEGFRRWGVVIEGRGMDCSACYILNTCRVRSSIGYCTHFCLMKPRCCGDPVSVQLLNAWLQREGGERLKFW